MTELLSGRIESILSADGGFLAKLVITHDKESCQSKLYLFKCGAPDESLLIWERKDTSVDLQSVFGISCHLLENSDLSALFAEYKK